MNTWDIVLQCIIVLNDKSLHIDKAAFKERRYGFNVSEFKFDHKMEASVRFIQTWYRKFLVKKQLKAARRTPGYMNITGTVKRSGLWLVYIMRASADLSTVKLTLKERNKKVTIVDRRDVSFNIHEQAEQQGQRYKLQGMKILFEKLLRDVRVDNDWAEQLNKEVE